MKQKKCFEVYVYKYLITPGTQGFLRCVDRICISLTGIMQTNLQILFSMYTQVSESYRLKVPRCCYSFLLLFPLKASSD